MGLAAIPVIASTAASAVQVVGGIMKMAESDDPRQSLGGPETLQGSTAEGLAAAYDKAPIGQGTASTMPRITGGQVPNLGVIEQRVAKIGKRFGPPPTRIA